MQSRFVNENKTDESECESNLPDFHLNLGSKFMQKILRIY